MVSKYRFSSITNHVGSDGPMEELWGCEIKVHFLFISKLFIGSNLVSEFIHFFFPGAENYSYILVIHVHVLVDSLHETSYQVTILNH
jgi:hypothetical protein